MGLRVTRWLRTRLQSAGGNRDLYQQIVRAIRSQVAQECRHLRRMHMALENVYAMGNVLPPQVPPGSDEGDEPVEAKELVDQLILFISDDTGESKRTVLDMLRGGEQASSSTAVSSTSSGMDQGLYQECEALRRWLNRVFEGALSTLQDEHMLQQDLPPGARVEPMTAEEGRVEGEENDDAAMVQKPRGEEMDVLAQGEGRRDDHGHVQWIGVVDAGTLEHGQVPRPADGKLEAESPSQDETATSTDPGEEPTRKRPAESARDMRKAEIIPMPSPHSWDRRPGTAYWKCGVRWMPPPLGATVCHHRQGQTQRHRSTI